MKLFVCSSSIIGDLTLNFFLTVSSYQWKFIHFFEIFDHLFGCSVGLFDIFFVRVIFLKKIRLANQQKAFGIEIFREI